MGERGNSVGVKTKCFDPCFSLLVLSVCIGSRACANSMTNIVDLRRLDNFHSHAKYKLSRRGTRKKSDRFHITRPTKA